MSHKYPLLLAAVAAMVFWPTALTAAEPPLIGMIRVTLDGRTFEGTPLAWNSHEVDLLGRDGRLWKFAPGEVDDFQKTSDTFRAYSTSEFRAALLRELGNDYEVSGTGHFLVAHPRGQSDKWAERFEELYRSFVHYFSVRGLTPAAPRFPLVGIVRRNRADFAKSAAAQGMATGGVEGYYDPETNRISIYDMGKPGEADWRHNASVLIHEATHQAAFNTGVHSRYSPPPRWLAEGLAMLFEAPGVHNPHTHPEAADRVNRGRLGDFRQAVLPRHRPELLASLVATDDMFRRNPGAAYAEAWALSFFLIETQPANYARYLRRTAAHEPFHECSASERTADFTAIFGSDWRMLEARFLRFLAAVK